MRSHVALLRGINVGGHNRVAMADLRRVVASAGGTDVATYIQSGNVVFSADDPDVMQLAAAIERAVADQLGVHAGVVVRTREELDQAVDDNPYWDEPNPKLVHAVFVAGHPAPDLGARIADAQRRAGERGSRDQARLVGRTVFLHTPDGFGRSELAPLLLRLGGADGPAGATARNWATVMKLVELCRGG